MEEKHDHGNHLISCKYKKQAVDFIFPDEQRMKAGTHHVCPKEEKKHEFGEDRFSR